MSIRQARGKFISNVKTHTIEGTSGLHVHSRSFEIVISSPPWKKAYENKNLTLLRTYDNLVVILIIIIILEGLRIAFPSYYRRTPVNRSPLGKGELAKFHVNKQANNDANKRTNKYKVVLASSLLTSNVSSARSILETGSYSNQATWFLREVARQ